MPFFFTVLWRRYTIVSFSGVFIAQGDAVIKTVSWHYSAIQHAAADTHETNPVLTSGGDGDGAKIAAIFSELFKLGQRATLDLAGPAAVDWG